MFRKLIIAVIFIFAAISANVVFAQGNPDQVTTLEKQIEEYKNKLTELRQQKNTLSSQIQYMDTQIYLTSLRIQETEEKIQKTQKEIDILSSRIEGLDSSLSYLSKMLLKRIVESYKKRSFSFFNILLDSESANDFISRAKYLKTAQENNQKLLVQVQSAKLNFEEQKKLREEKKVELDQLKITLNNQKTELNNQKAAKQKLLTDTQNDEATYQRLLTEAREMLSRLSSFVQSSGLGTPIEPDGLGKGSDGNYFSQRDRRWAYQIIGNSSTDCNGHPCTVLEAGCLISSIAMVLKKQGADINPLSIASNLDYFQANTALMKLTLPNGLGRQQIPTSEIDSQLERGYVIAGINYGGCQERSDHFIVLTKREGNEYKVHDPLCGPDLDFSSLSNCYQKPYQICWAEILN